jgi:hypothetical protein
MWVCQQCHYPIFDTVASFKMHPASFFYLLHTRWWLSTLSCAGWAFVPTLTLLWSQLLPDSRELAVVDEAVVSFKLHPISFLYIVCIYTVCSTLSCSEWPYGCTLTPLLSQTFPLISDLRELGETLGLGDCHRPWYRWERYPDYGVSS